MLRFKEIKTKFFWSVFLDRIKQKTDEIIEQYQGGFRGGRSTTDQIFIVRQLFQKMWEFDKEMHTYFVDLKNHMTVFIGRV